MKPEQLGGVLILILLLALLLGILKCAWIRRRPTASPPCMTALALMLLAWFFFGLGDALVLWYERELPGVKVLGRVTGILLTVASLVLGINGLARFDRRRFQQGRVQAFWAVALGGPIGVAFCVLTVVGTRSPFLVHPVSDVVDQVHAGPDEVPVHDLENTDFNFSLRPSQEWRLLTDPKAHLKDAFFVLRLAGTGIHCGVVAERPGADVSLRTHTEAVKLRILVSKGMREQEVLEQTEETVQLGGLTFAVVRTRARDRAKGVIEQEDWIAAQGGYVWQFLAWCGEGEGPRLREEVRRLAESFRVLDPPKTGGEPTVDRSRPELGYATRLSGLGWGASQLLAAITPLADLAVTRTFEKLVVVPVRFAGEAPDLEAAAHGFVSILHFDHPAQAGERGASDTPWRIPGGEGLELRREFKSDDGSDILYHFRIARWRTAAVMVAGWWDDQHGDAELMSRSMNAIDLAEPLGDAPQLTADQREGYGNLLNQIGQSCFRRNLYGKAAGWFRQAFEQTGSHPVFLENLARALEREGRHQDGISYLAEHLANFPKRLSLGLSMARLQALGGDAAAGTNTFVRLIEGGFEDEDELQSWLELLAARKRYPEALRSVDAWIAKHPGDNPRRWREEILMADK